MPSVADVIKVIELWLRLATFLHHPLKSALLFVLHNKGNRTDYVGLPENEIDLYNELAKKNGIIKNLFKTRVLKQDQVDALLPPGANKTDSSTFDVTLIVVLIINFTTLPAPQNGWRYDVDPTDFSTGAFVLRARQWRNNFIHGTEPDGLLKANFDKIWLDGEVIVNGLGLTTIDTNALKNINLDVRNSIVLNSMMFYINNIQKKLDTHDKKLDTHDKKLDTHGKKLTSLQGDMAKVNTDVNKINSEVEDVKFDFGELNKQLEAIKKEISAKQNQENTTIHQGMLSFITKV